MVGQTQPEMMQVVFRLMLKAMSYPGRCCSVAEGAPEALGLLAADCLIDHEATFAAIGFETSQQAERIQRRTGSVCVEPNQADFLFINGNCSQGRIESAKRGTPAYPDEGATLVYQLPTAQLGELEANRLEAVRMTGPGIKEMISPPVDSLDQTEYALLRDINAGYPLGVDTFIMWGASHVMAIPRSTRIDVS
ncbi:MAG: phosphonate C-P lyase system protein PhnH [Desulfobacteraceae bacterium]